MGVGDGLADNLSLGPLQNAMQYDRVMDLLRDIKTSRLDIPTGEQASRDPKGKGYFIRPTIVNNPPQSSRIVREEPFGKTYATSYKVYTMCQRGLINDYRPSYSVT
jgi:acyl-CoA reductase-like NAD-dependent aldehyde dehydrogenase